MKKRVFYVIAGLLVVSIAAYLYASTNFARSGVVIGTKAQELAANITLGEGDLYVAGSLEVDGVTRLDGTVSVNTALTVSGGNLVVVTSNGAYFVRISTANTTTANGYIFQANANSASFKCQGTAGIYPASGTSLPTTGYEEGALFYDSNINVLYVSTETVVGAVSWKATY